MSDLIRAMETSNQLRIPQNQRIAYAALRLLGGFLSGGVYLNHTKNDEMIDNLRAEIQDLEGHLKVCSEPDDEIRARLSKARQKLAEILR